MVIYKVCKGKNGKSKKETINGVKKVLYSKSGTSKKYVRSKGKMMGLSKYKKMKKMKSMKSMKSGGSGVNGTQLILGGKKKKSSKGKGESKSKSKRTRRGGEVGGVSNFMDMFNK